ncbi:hypothetical protein INT48_003956 [Thamnidium elegans]|uniref:Uncharacterized protein n=1 Tax=Thamnidium elegans TaxID=101142 RepID=A0A8H7SS19_9FUNG|nr:hypothetical protein INT48_003956 [Thamnidium elegans]
MEDVYDLLQHTHVAIFYLGVNTAQITCCPTSARYVRFESSYLIKDSYITYDKHKSNVLSWGDQSVKNNKEDTVQIDVSREKLYQLFKKGKDCWDQDDLFTLTAVSDFIRLYVEKLIGNLKGEIKDHSALHYVSIVPSEWEEEIREVLIRPIFVQANLISKDDHQDRLLFCSDIESTYYSLSDPKSKYFTEMTRNTILGRIVAVKENQVSIKLDLISIGKPLFDFSGSVTRPKIMNSNAMSLTSDDVKNGIREFIKIKFSFNAQEDTILNIMKELGNDTFTRMVSNEDKDEAFYIMKPFITDENISELDKNQKELIRSIRPFDICAEISKRLPNNLKQLLPNSLVKEYSILKFNDKYTSEIESDEGLLQWSRFLFEYNRLSFDSSYIVPKYILVKNITDLGIMRGTFRYSATTIQNSNIYSKPRILSTEHSAISSSIFLNSKPDAIMNIDILLESTVLSFSLLDENGLIKEIWDHDYFVPDISLRSLGSFFTFSEVIILNVKDSITTQGEGLLPVIQQSFKLRFPLKYFFMVAQLYEDYVQLTLNQVVTESGSDHEDQETVIIQEEIIPIPNIYDSFCFNVWSNITEDSSLIQLCDTHKGCNDNDLLDIFSLENQAEFTNNLKEYISKDILNKNLTTQKAEKTTVYLSKSYDETDYFLYEQRIDVDQYTIPRFPNKLLQPILQQEPCSYKGFQVGVLRQVYSESFGFGFENPFSSTPVVLKSNREDPNAILIDKKKVFPLFKKEDKMNENQLNRVFYLNTDREEVRFLLRLYFFKLKPVASLRSDELIGLEHTIEKFGEDLYLDNINKLKSTQDIPYMISIAYHGYSSSLYLELKIVGDETSADFITVIAEPMTLCRS